MTEQDQLFLSLLRKLDAQTEALHRLTGVVEALVMAMADEDDDEVAPTTYMDGTPR